MPKNNNTPKTPVKQPLIVYSTNFLRSLFFVPLRLTHVLFFNNAMVATCHPYKQYHIRVIRQNHRRHNGISSITVVLTDNRLTSFR